MTRLHLLHTLYHKSSKKEVMMGEDFFRILKAHTETTLNTTWAYMQGKRWIIFFSHRPVMRAKNAVDEFTV